MRLRTTLLLAFAGLSLVQVVAVVPIALKNLTELLEAQQAARTDQLMVTARASVARLEDDVRRSLDDLANSPEVEDVVRDASKEGASASLASAARQLMTARGLSVLSLLDENGKTLSSGHLPARIGEPDDALFALTKTQGAKAVMVELRDQSGIQSFPALVAARALDYGDTRVWAVGGLLIEGGRAAELSHLTGARVEVIAAGRTFAASGKTTQPSSQRSLEFPLHGSSGMLELRLYFSTAEVAATRTEVLRGFAILAAAGLFTALAVGFFFSRRVTRPVEALTDAARKIGSGALDVQVAILGTGELKELLDAFNRMTRELKSTTDKLIASERIAAWQEVARRLAHEIKNPLTPIRMSLETLLAAREKSPATFEKLFKESAEAVLEEVDRLRRIVDEFSQFARLPRPQLQPLQLDALVRQILTLHPDHDGVKYALELEPGLTVQGDGDQLTQVVVNLLKNAGEALRGSGKTGTVTLRTRKTGALAVLEVSDDGPGIPEALLPRLFEPYVTTKPTGTGLGLAIAARIAQEHEGRLEAGNNTPGPGALFRLTLPLAA